MTRSALERPESRGAPWENANGPGRRSGPEEVSTMQKIRLSRHPQQARRPRPLDLRTPSGRPLPY